VYRTLYRFKDIQSAENRQRPGRPRTVRTPGAIKAVRSRIHRNPLRKQKILPREMNISTPSMSRIIKSDLKMGTY
jgi:hypothetical protein